MEHDTYEVKNAEVQAKLRKLGEYLKGEMPQGMGFTLLMADHGEGGSTFYISSIERDGALDAMKEFLIRQGKIPQDGAVLSPFIERPTESGLPPAVEKLREAAAVIIGAAKATNSHEIRVLIDGIVAPGIEGKWEVRAHKIP